VSALRGIAYAFLHHLVDCAAFLAEGPVIEFKHILAPVDFSDFSARSLAHAAALARWYEAKLTVLHVAVTFEVLPVKGELGVPVQVIESAAREDVDHRLRELLDAGGVAPNAVAIARTGDPAKTIVDEAVSNKADLVVMGTHGRRGFNRLLLGSVTESVLRHAPCPVLTVPPRAPVETAEVVTFERILCPTDFSASARRAFKLALDLARQADGTVTLLHAIEWLAEEEPRTTAHFNVPEFRHYLEQDARSQLQELVAAESTTWAKIETEVVFGRAHREILRAADMRQSELIVMGVQGRGGIDLAVFGSATQQVVRSAACPVLTVRATQET
jgi:nucleotide-binding universal stress UspA family protein